MANHSVPSASRRYRVVIVDDSRTMQAILDQTLAIDLGFEIVGVAKDGASAIPMIRDLRPDLVTIDLHMPYIDGRELLEALRDFSNMRKVVISAHASNSLEMQACLVRLGADACIGKIEMSRDRKAFCRTLHSIVSTPKRAAPNLSGKPGSAQPSRIGAVPAASTPALTYPVPVDEGRRIQALDHLRLANDDIDHRLDLLTAHLVQTTSYPGAVMAFIHRHTSWAKSAQGFARGHVPRAQAICSHTICGDEPLVVPDTQQDLRFMNLELIKSGQVRAYVGCPIITSANVRLGAICLLDSRPRNVSSAELISLRSMARIAAELIETTTARLHQAA